MELTVSQIAFCCVGTRIDETEGANADVLTMRRADKRARRKRFILMLVVSSWKGSRRQGVVVLFQQATVSGNGERSSTCWSVAEPENGASRESSISAD